MDRICRRASSAMTSYTSRGTSRMLVETVSLSLIPDSLMVFCYQSNTYLTL